MNIKLKLESYLKGGYPIGECIDFWIFSKGTPFRFLWILGKIKFTLIA